MLKRAAGRFDALGLTGRKGIVAAVSGGSNSLALLILLTEWMAQQPARVPIVAVTVDHRLRPEAADEARFVGAICTSLGIRHRTMSWEGAKPATGLAEAARAARYRLLVQAADETGADTILTGHTLDDQAETVAMRAERGEGRGLAGMAETSLLFGRVWLLRPLLGIRREDLRDVLKARGVTWIDDPSNENAAAERVRFRRAMAGMPGEVERLTALAAQAGVDRQALGGAVAAAIARATLVSPGLALLPAELLEPGEAQIYALRILLATMGGTEQLPDIDATRALMQRLAGGGRSGTLARTLVERRKTGLYLCRESRDLPLPQTLARDALWDGRFRLPRGSAPARVEAIGAERAAVLAERSEGAPRRLVASAFAAEPLAEAERAVSPWARLLPGFDIEAHDAAARLIGARPAPPNPMFQRP